MKVLVLGGTGLVGKAVMKELSLLEQVEVINVISRRKVNPFPVDQYPKVKHFEGSLENLDELNEAFQCDALLCSLGTTIKVAGSKEAFKAVDFDYPLRAGQILKEKSPNAHFLIISAMGSDPKSMVFYNQVKGKVEEALSAIDFHRLTILRPSLILGGRSERRVLEDVGQSFAKVVDPILSRLFPNYAGVEYQKIAKKMVAEAMSKNERPAIKIILSSEIKSMPL